LEAARSDGAVLVPVDAERPIRDVLDREPTAVRMVKRSVAHQADECPRNSNVHRPSRGLSYSDQAGQMGHLCATRGRGRVGVARLPCWGVLPPPCRAARLSRVAAPRPGRRHPRRVREVVAEPLTGIRRVGLAVAGSRSTIDHRDPASSASVDRCRPRPGSPSFILGRTPSTQLETKPMTGGLTT